MQHIFPGGFLPSVTCLVDSITKGGKGKLVVEQIDNIGPRELHAFTSLRTKGRLTLTPMRSDYARTLRAWRQRFESTFDQTIVPSLRSTYPSLASSPTARKEIEIFRRKWIYYYVYCETGFAMRALGDHVLTVTREGNLSLD